MFSQNEEQDQLHLALNRAYFFLRFRPRTEKEVADYLYKKADTYHWKPSIVQKVVDSLKENKYIDDENFVEWFVNGRNSQKPKSAFALTHELQKYGVNKDVIANFFQSNPVDEEELALSALRRRWQRFEYLDKSERFKKSAAFLSSRGFSFEIIRKTVQTLEQSK